MERRLELIGAMTPAIWIHLVAAAAALTLGAAVLWRRKGDRRHRLAGRAWVALMLVVAGSSLFIREERDGAFSAIHVLIVVTLASLTQGVLALRGADRARAVRTHRTTMQALYAAALLIAGGFTFLPGRLLGRLVTEETALPHAVIVTAMVGSGVLILARAYRPGTAPPVSPQAAPSPPIGRRAPRPWSRSGR